MATRRAARELALQALYQLDLRAADEDPTLSLAGFWVHFDPDGEATPFARELVEGVVEARERIDTVLAAAAQHWRLERLARVDLNLLRLATFELFGRPEIPASVTINEAIEIARRFGSVESAAFVNGVLDHIAASLGVKEPRRHEAE